MTQHMRGLTALVSAIVCCCLLIGTTAIASVERDTDKAKRAEQAQTLKKVNTTPARDQQADKQSGSILSKPKNQISKKVATTAKQRPVTPKQPFTGHPTPPNQDVIRQGGDDIGAALTIPSIPYADAGTTSGYTDDYDEICPYDAPGSADVVYRYTPPSDKLVTIDLCPSGYDTKVYVYENAAGNLVACNDDADDCDLLYRSLLEHVLLTAGNTYYIVVDGYGGEDGSYDLTITEEVACIVDCPVNHEDEGEACGDSINDGCNLTTPSYGEVKCGDTICGTAWADGDLRDTDWFLKTIADDTTVTWSGTAGFDFALIIAKLDGCGEGEITVVESIAADACDTATISATIGAGTYVFFVAPSVFAGYTCAGGPWNYTVWLDCAEPPAGPSNNDCEDAIAIGDVTDYPFTTTGATIDGGVVCTSFGFNQIHADVWFCYTASCDGIATASLCNSDYDTKMAVYDGCVCPAVDMIGCNDDACGDDGLKSEVVFPVVAGNTYLIRIGGYDGESGDGLLTISCGAAAENDNCSDVVPQTLPAVFSGDNTGATSDCALTAPDAETWAAFTISSCTDVTVEYCGTSPVHETIYIVLFEECPCEGGDYIFADDYNFDDCGDGNATMYFNQLQPGTYYYAILSSAVDGSVGPYTISFTGSPCPAGYCPAAGGTCDEYISRVAVGSIDNSSNCDNYADYTGLSTAMDIGTGYPITVENGFPYSSDQCGIWVDWNQDYDFNDADETIVVSGTPGPGDYTATITPPAGAIPGATRMRVRITYTGAVSPCGTTTYGEVEDYTITVNGGPVGDNLLVSPDSIYAFMSGTVDPFYIVLDLGNDFAPGYDVNDINLATVQVNGYAVDSATVLPGAPGFSGPVLRIKVNAASFIHPHYESLAGLTLQTAEVTGSMNDATPFSTTSETFVYGGHPVGDLNMDGRVTVGDLTYFVQFLFNQGRPPQIMAVADLNHTNTVTVADLVYLVQYLFNNGPAPRQ